MGIPHVNLMGRHADAYSQPATILLNSRVSGLRMGAGTSEEYDRFASRCYGWYPHMDASVPRFEFGP